MKWILMVLLVVGGIASLGCGERSTDGGDISSVKYPGAPIIHIKQISFDWTEYKSDSLSGPAFYHKAGVLRYLLETQGPLPYDIKVNLNAATARRYSSCWRSCWCIRSIFGS